MHDRPGPDGLKRNLRFMDQHGYEYHALSPVSIFLFVRACLLGGEASTELRLSHLHNMMDVECCGPRTF